MSPDRRIDLDGKTIHFVVRDDHELKAGDTLIIRDVQPADDGIRVSAVPEKVVKDEAAKLFA